MGIDTPVLGQSATEVAESFVQLTHEQLAAQITENPEHATETGIDTPVLDQSVDNGMGIDTSVLDQSVDDRMDIAAPVLGQSATSVAVEKSPPPIPKLSQEQIREVAESFVQQSHERLVDQIIGDPKSEQLAVRILRKEIYRGAQEEARISHTRASLEASPQREIHRTLANTVETSNYYKCLIDPSISKGFKEGSYPLHMDMTFHRSKYNKAEKDNLHRTILEQYPCTLLKHIRKEDFANIFNQLPIDQKRALLLKATSHEQLKRIMAEDSEYIMNNNMTPEQVYEVLKKNLSPEAFEKLYGPKMS